MCLIGQATQNGGPLARTIGTFAIPCAGPRLSVVRGPNAGDRVMASKRFWAELKSSEFAALDPNSTVAILPVAATEQHGPHLPVMTDTAIGEGLIKTVLARLTNDLRVLFLPIQTIGKSNEHLRSPGTITHSADTLIRGWCEIGESVQRAGLRKLVIVNS